MRVNVYAEELTREIEVVTTVADSKAKFIGLRIYLASPDELHRTPDDDRSAITLWVRSGIHGFQPGDEDGLMTILNDCIIRLHDAGLRAVTPQA